MSINHPLIITIFVDKFTRFFEWKYFKVASALSYGIYLVQFQIFAYIVGTLRGPVYFTAYNQMVRIKISHAIF